MGLGLGGLKKKSLQGGEGQLCFGVKNGNFGLGCRFGDCSGSGLDLLGVGSAGVLGDGGGAGLRGSAGPHHPGVGTHPSVGSPSQCGIPIPFGVPIPV